MGNKGRREWPTAQFSHRMHLLSLTIVIRQRFKLTSTPTRSSATYCHKYIFVVILTCWASGVDNFLLQLFLVRKDAKLLQGVTLSLRAHDNFILKASSQLLIALTSTSQDRDRRRREIQITIYHYYNNDSKLNENNDWHDNNNNLASSVFLSYSLQ